MLLVVLVVFFEIGFCIFGLDRGFGENFVEEV